jgi:hypothetical protein
MMSMATDELSGIFAATVTTVAGREVYNEGTESEIDEWLREFRRAERLARVDIRELPLSECHGIWTSPGTSPEEDYA